MIAINLIQNGCPSCECGCGERVTRFNNRFISGHNIRIQPTSFGNPEHLRKVIEARKQSGYVFSEKHKKRLSESHKGHIPWNKGKTGVYSQETLNNISNSLKGKVGPNKGREFSEEWRSNISKVTKGRVSHFKGKKHSKESKIKISEAGKGRKQSEREKEKRKKAMNRSEVLLKISGFNGSNWKGGISCEPYCDAWADKEFKEDIRKRDNYQCQNPECSGIYQKLGIHHIDYNKKNCHPNNLITLCNSCNSKANFNREYWENLFMDIIKEKELAFG